MSNFLISTLEHEWVIVAWMWFNKLLLSQSSQFSVILHVPVARALHVEIWHTGLFQRRLKIILNFYVLQPCFFLIWWRVLCFVSNSCWTVVGFVVLFALYMTVCISLKGVNQNAMKKDFLFAFPSYTLVGSFFVLNANQPQQCCWYTHSRHTAVSV